MRGPFAFAVLAASAACLGGCSASGSLTVGGPPQYTYTCCSPGLQPSWHPGDTMVLHWTAQPAAAAGQGSAVTVTLTASLIGPYATVDSLKAGGSASITLVAAPATTTSTSAAAPVSTIALPATLPAGFYNLTSTTTLASGYVTSGATVLQVTSKGT